MQLPKSSSEFLKRLLFTVVFIVGYISILYAGPIAIVPSLIGIQLKCVSEIINIGYTVNKIPNISNQRLITWYLLTAGNFYFYGEIIARYFQAFTRNSLLHVVFTHHRFIAFWIYLSGITWFVSSIVRRHRLGQYKLLAWIHIVLIIIVFQSYLSIENMFTGLIWLVLSTFLVIVNDSFAYVFGRLFGRRPLIEVSPKKTWEGFIGGAVSTVLFGVVAGHYLSRFEYLVCPIEYAETANGVMMSYQCQHLSYHFNLQKYSLALPLLPDLRIETYPFVFHSVSLSLFASIIAPFGGFFASAFKRSLNVKDFADTIPGHGGFMDRFDCQYLMGAFVNVYIWTFLRTYNVERIFDKVLNMSEEDQLKFFLELEKQVENVVTQV